MIIRIYVNIYIFVFYVEKLVSGTTSIYDIELV